MNQRSKPRRQPSKSTKISRPSSPDIHTLSDTRALSAVILYQVFIQQKSLNSLLPLASKQIEPKDRGLLQEIVFGSCRWFFWLQQQYQVQLNKPLHRNDFLVECLLIIGTYQLIFTRIPPHACLNETVQAAEILGLSRFKGLINALLRQISEQTNSSEHIESAIASHPNWFVEKLKHNWPDQWQDILLQNNQHPPMSLRLNLSKIDAEAETTREYYLNELNLSGIEAVPSSISSTGIILNHAVAVQEIPGFEEGRISVQDEAAQLSSQLLQLKPKLRVLDACAAPGGKTCAMLEREPSLSVTALDSDPLRADRIRENLQRLSLQAEIKIAQAEEVTSWWDGNAFDRILLDAPCSATGVIRRHPDIKLLRKEGDIKQLAELQFKLIHALWQILKPGGLMVYATCSIFSQENSRIIERFLKQQSNAICIPTNLACGIDTGFGTQLFPQKDSHDGFFYACLQKTQ